MVLGSVEAYHQVHRTLEQKFLAELIVGAAFYHPCEHPELPASCLSQE